MCGVLTEEEKKLFKEKMAARAAKQTAVSSYESQKEAEEVHQKLVKARKMSIIVPIVMILLVAVVGTGCFFAYQKLSAMRNSIQQMDINSESSTESTMEDAVKADASIENADDLMWTGTYTKETIDEAVKNLYSYTDAEAGITIYYSVADSVPTSDGTFNGKSVYENSGDLAISPVQFVLVRTSDTDIQMKAKFAWYSDADKKIGTTDVQLKSDKNKYNTHLKDGENNVEDKDGKVLESITVTPTVGFNDLMSQMIEKKSGKYELVGDKLKTENEFTEAQINGYKELADVMNCLV